MVVRKSDLSSASYRITSGLYDFSAKDKALTPAGFRAVLTKEKITGKRAAVLMLAYDAAKAKAKANPNRTQIRAEVSRALSSLSNERAKGRVNDGYVDKREAALVKGDLAAGVYKLVDSGVLGANSKPTAAKELALKAPLTKVAAALKVLEPIIDAGFKAFDASGDPDWEGPAAALRKAANDAGLSSKGRAAILTALNGATTRSDGGDYPGAADVKQLLRNAQAKLKLSDAAQVVDFAHPERKPVVKKDGIVSGIELDRTPAATGMTSRALLEYSASL